MQGLENKLNVNIGDLIILQSPLLEVSGYVIDIPTSEKIKLSHENPYFGIAGWRSWNYHYRINFSSGNRFYNLRKFKSYKVLRKHKPKDK